MGSCQGGRCGCRSSNRVRTQRSSQSRSRWGQNVAGRALRFESLEDRRMLATLLTGDEIREPLVDAMADSDDLGSGVFLHDGAVVVQRQVLSIPGRGIDWSFDLTYRSDVTAETVVGHNWQFNYQRHLYEVTLDNLVELPDCISPSQSWRCDSVEWVRTH